MERRAGGIWYWVHTSFAVLVRLGVIVGAFAVGYRWGLAVALIASLAVLTLSGPTAIICVAVGLGISGEAAGRLTGVTFRVQFAMALILLGASIPTKLPALIALCAVCFVLAALYRLMTWAAEQARAG